MGLLVAATHGQCDHNESHATVLPRTSSTRLSSSSSSSWSPSVWSSLRLLTVVLLALLVVAPSPRVLARELGTHDSFNWNASISSVTPNVSLLFLTADDASFFTNAILQYGVLRPDVDIRTVSFSAVGNDTGPTRAWNSLIRGEADAAVIAFTPTAAQSAANPDFIAYPLFASSGALIFNLPGFNTGDLILSPFVIARIYAGVVTNWNDSLITALNPNVTLPSHPITVVLQSDRTVIARRLTLISSQVDSEFPIVPSYQPVWMTDRYAAYQYESGLDGPPSYVISTPYSIGFSYVPISTKLGACIAALVNQYGNAVLPSFATLGSGWNELVVVTTRAADGTLTYTASNNVNNAAGPNSYPYIFVMSAILPRTFSRQTCRTRSELVKFLRYMIHADNVRFSLSLSEYAAMLSSEAESQVGSEAAYEAITCNARTVDSGTIDPIEVHGAGPTTRHITTRTLLLEMYALKDSVMSYSYANMDEGAAMVELATAGSDTDTTWTVPMTFETMYPGYTDAYITSGLVQMIHVSVFGVVPQFNVPSSVATAIASSLPLALDMETLALIFLGEITSWTDSRLTARNPSLTAAYAGLNPNITLVLCGTGLASAKPHTVSGNHLILRLNQTEAFKNSGITWTLPVNWTPIMDRLDAKGLTYSLVSLEVHMEAEIARTDGAIGYVQAYQNTSTPASQFSLVRTVETSTGASEEFIVEPIPANWLNAAAQTTPTTDIAFALNAATSTDYAYRSTWPIIVVMSIGLPTDLSTSNSLGLSADSLCFRQTRAAKFGLWVATDASITAPSYMTGRATISQLDEWAAFNTKVLYNCKCSGVPILYTPPVDWHRPYAFSLLGQITACILAISCVPGFVVLWLYRHRTIIRFGGVLLHSIKLFGALLVNVAVIFFTLTPTARMCNTMAWLLLIGIALLLSPLCAKLMRVYYISKHRHGLKMRKISNDHILAFVIVWLLVHLLMLALAQGEGGLLQPTTYMRVHSDVDHYYTQCSISNDTVFAYGGVMMGMNASLLLISSLLAIGLRGVTSAFNESKHISWALWNILASAVACAVSVYLVEMQSDIGFLLIEIFVLWAAGFAVAVTLTYKIMVLFADTLSAMMRHMQIGSSSSHSSLSGSSHASSLTESSSHTSSHNSSSNGDGGIGGSASNSGVKSDIFYMPPLEKMTLTALEQYITSAEVHLRKTRERRKEVFGTASPVPRGNSTGRLAWAADHLTRVTSKAREISVLRRPTAGAKRIDGDGHASDDSHAPVAASVTMRTPSISPSPSAAAAVEKPPRHPLASSSATGAAGFSRNPRSQLRVQLNKTPVGADVTHTTDEADSTTTSGVAANTPMTVIVTPAGTEERTHIYPM